ncbi:MAG: MiaB/RimO family radical SAM methylthiotransferase [Desulfovibrio sp.]|nr:MiaB/RimO family radical SAM methylthiotransferase [Desulfovibrio sp.]
MAHWTFHILTFGCKVNQYESESLRQAWLRLGGEESACAENADYILINSCAITSRAERNCRNAIFRMRQLAPGAQIVLTGCAAQFYLDFKPRRHANWAAPDLCVSQADKAVLLAGPNPAVGPGFGASSREQSQPLPASGRSRPIIKIEDGCSQKCSYCIVPQTRGLPVSRAPREIIAECRSLAAAGYGELVISGVNLRQYRDFWQLLARLDSELAGEFAASCRLRISSLDPGMLTGAALDVIANCRMLCPHLHLSLQHASPAVLSAMRRPRYDACEVLRIGDDLARIWPGMGLGADIIAGFPGETEADLAALLDFIAASRLTYAHVFPYSRRPGTVAAQLPGQVEMREKNRRAALVRAAIASKSEAFLLRQLQIPVMNVVADAPRPGKNRRGVNEYYAPCEFAAEPVAQNPAGMIEVRPVGLNAAGITVMPLA